MTSRKLTSEEAVLRRKILGVKIRHARTRAGLNEKEVAEKLGMLTNEIIEIELGQQHVTLPHLEAMALLFSVPVSYFWSDGVIREANLDFPAQEAIAIRQRIIGVLLRQARTEAGRSAEELADALGVPVSRVSDYEFGKVAIPLQELELVTAYLKLPMSYFVDEGMAPHQNGNYTPTLNEVAEFSQLPQDVREFLSNPANLLYINIAMKLSELSADTLRALAEGLLEVTY